MKESTNHNYGDEGHALEVASHLINRLIGLVSTVIVLGFTLVLALVVAYLYLVLNPEGFSGAASAAEYTQSLLLTIWQGVEPIAGTALRVVAPVILILGVLIVVAYLAKRGATPFDLSRVTNDLPSFLAVVIILTICLLPLSGLEVPSVLNNIALVVVGFYFGKRDSIGSNG
ncbi:hypothetical protein [Sinimarinibacterium flocculans]|uniref:hypothetical protein n=1 Tax=Sinimarinibacterium flocculans TaxID=985250 RepID=UPI0035196C49